MPCCVVGCYNRVEKGAEGLEGKARNCHKQKLLEENNE